MVLLTEVSSFLDFSANYLRHRMPGSADKLYSCPYTTSSNYLIWPWQLAFFASTLGWQMTVSVPRTTCSRYLPARFPYQGTQSSCQSGTWAWSFWLRGGSGCSQNSYCVTCSENCEWRSPARAPLTNAHRRPGLFLMTGNPGFEEARLLYSNYCERFDTISYCTILTTAPSSNF